MNTAHIITQLGIFIAGRFISPKEESETQLRWGHYGHYTQEPEGCVPGC
jgi:hypothetical protein